jgi:tetratricopeptide (TPR) repeat protein
MATGASKRRREADQAPNFSSLFQSLELPEPSADAAAAAAAAEDESDSEDDDEEEAMAAFDRDLDESKLMRGVHIGGNAGPKGAAGGNQELGAGTGAGAAQQRANLSQILGPSTSALRSAALAPNGKAPRRKKRPKKNYEIAALLGEANSAFFNKDYRNAIAHARDVIRRAPEMADAYQTLGLIYEAMEDGQKAFQAEMIAAHLRNTSTDEWRALGIKAAACGEHANAVFCFSKVPPALAAHTRALSRPHGAAAATPQVIRSSPDDIDTYWLRALSHLETGASRLGGGGDRLADSAPCLDIPPSRCRQASSRGRRKGASAVAKHGRAARPRVCGECSAHHVRDGKRGARRTRSPHGSSSAQVGTAHTHHTHTRARACARPLADALCLSRAA